MTYEVRLEVFEGPFDLLLQLIARRKLEITEIDLADITADFLASLTAIDEVDLETATHFLVVAATLIELKAARLLPREQQDEVEDLLAEARDLLYARLLEYRAFRAVSEDLAFLLERAEPFVGREVPLESRFRRLVPDTTLGVDAVALARLAAAATAPPPIEMVSLEHVRRATLSIRDATRSMLERLHGGSGSESFDELTAGTERHERVVYFLAALELYKLGHLELEQPDLRGPMAVTRVTGGRDLESLTETDLDKLDEYTDDPGSGTAEAGDRHEVGSDLDELDEYTDDPAEVSDTEFDAGAVVDLTEA